MAANNYKPLSPSQYKGIQHYELNGVEYWKATKEHDFRAKIKTFPTEREAARAYDIMCIEFGLPPVNILKPKL